jgi:uncharacterized iron-regulated protein
MRRAMALIALSLTVLTGCRSSPEWVHPYGAGNPLAGSLHDMVQGRPVDEQALLARIADADFVLIGASRDNLDHQRLAARLIEALGRDAGPLAAAAFEMIETDQQPALVEHPDGSGRDLAGLGPELRLEQRGWLPFEAYRPALAAAREAGAELVAAGLPGRAVAAVMAEGTGTLPAAFARRTGLDQPLPPLLAADLERAIAATYCGALAPGLLGRLADAERARDASLADRLTAVAGRGRGVLVAGRERVRKDWGAPWYIEWLRPGARTVSIALLEVEHAAEMPTVGLAFDYVWLTPGAHPPGEDGCRQPGDGLDQTEARRIAPMRRGPLS